VPSVARPLRSRCFVAVTAAAATLAAAAAAAQGRFAPPPGFRWAREDGRDFHVLPADPAGQPAAVIPGISEDGAGDDDDVEEAAEPAGRRRGVWASAAAAATAAGWACAAAAAAIATAGVRLPWEL
jgi:hypothetical protein